jgi:excinuclease UvrABC nuclease subunit
MSRWIKHIVISHNKYYSLDEKNDFESTLIHLPKQPAVYAIYEFSEVIYIGSTTSLRDRFNLHKKNSFTGLEYPHIKYSLSKKHGDWAMRELRLIKRLNPRMNKNHSKGKAL